MRKLAVLGGLFGSVGMAMAEGGQTNSVTNYDTFLSTLSTEITTKLNAVWPVLGSVMLIIVGFAAAFFAWRKLKSQTSR